MQCRMVLPDIALDVLAGSASEFAPYLDLLPSKVELQESDLYYAGGFADSVCACLFLVFAHGFLARIFFEHLLIIDDR